VRAGQIEPSQAALILVVTLPVSEDLPTSKARRLHIPR
jgi:hypothetical protein